MYFRWQKILSTENIGDEVKVVFEPREGEASEWCITSKAVFDAWMTEEPQDLTECYVRIEGAFQTDLISLFDMYSGLSLDRFFHVLAKAQKGYLTMAEEASIRQYASVQGQCLAENEVTLATLKKLLTNS